MKDDWFVQELAAAGSGDDSLGLLPSDYPETNIEHGDLALLSGDLMGQARLGLHTDFARESGPVRPGKGVSVGVVRPGSVSGSENMVPQRWKSWVSVINR